MMKHVGSSCHNIMEEIQKKNDPVDDSEAVTARTNDDIDQTTSIVSCRV